MPQSFATLPSLNTRPPGIFVAPEISCMRNKELTPAQRRWLAYHVPECEGASRDIIIYCIRHEVTTIHKMRKYIETFGTFSLENIVFWVAECIERYGDALKEIGTTITLAPNSRDITTKIESVRKQEPSPTAPETIDIRVRGWIDRYFSGDAHAVIVACVEQVQERGNENEISLEEIQERTAMSVERITAAVKQIAQDKKPFTRDNGYSFSTNGTGYKLQIPHGAMVQRNSVVSPRDSSEEKK